MEVFFYLGITGIGLIMLGKSSIEEDTHRFNIKILDEFSGYIESDIWAKINLKYGKLLLITGIMGMLFYKILGLLMTVIMLLILIFYLKNTFVSGYKYFRNFND